MTDKDNIGYGKVSFIIRGGLLEYIDRIASERHTDRTEILNEAISEYIQRKKNPSLIRDQIRQALREEPDLVAEAIEIYTARKIRGG